MNIIIAGGGTAGSIIPLVAVAGELKKRKPDTHILLIGTRTGVPEKKIVSDYNFAYKSILGGKIRRYFDLRNATDIFLTIIGFIQSLIIIIRNKTDVILGAGGYISVPVIWAGWVLRKKILIHQQDLKPSLSNILTRGLANRITVTFEKSLNFFPAAKTVWTGNPVRREVRSGRKETALKKFSLWPDVPIVLVTGGGTGASHINSIINQALPGLIEICQVIHITGYGKKVTGIASNRYQQYEFLTDDMPHLLAAADLIVSRAGLSALTEFSILGKPVILIPLPDSHQEENAQYFSEKNAAIVMEEKNISPSIIADKIKELLADKNSLMMLSATIKKMIKPNATDTLIGEIEHLLKR
jgi:UDP-N-acetylglucosamine--N-acetylmuramyl-(pentapeptide) pyrophosphoryl-undecaprenol N-acetylglucosamine transferase